MAKKQVIIILFFSLLLVFNAFLFIAAWIWFPANGGFTRYVLFVHPDQSTNSSGYFIIIDELADNSQQFEIDWVLHGRGNLTIAEDSQSIQYSTQSYLSVDIISLNVTFLNSIQEITTYQGEFHPAYRYTGADKNPTYIKAKYSGDVNPLLGAVLYPRNDSDSSSVFPNISAVNSDEMGKIGNSDLIYYQPSRTLQTFTNPNNILTDSKIVFIHKNLSNYLKYFFLQDASTLSFEGQTYFSGAHLKNLLVNYANATNQVTGYINAGEIGSSLISLYVPFSAASIIIDGLNQTFTQIGSVITFPLKTGSFIISIANLSGNITHEEQNPLQRPPIYNTIPLKNSWEFNISKILNTNHPFLLFNQTELGTLRQKINESIEPWKSWYDSFTSDADVLKNINVDSLAEDERWVPIHKLAIKFAIDGGQDCLNKLSEFLLDMPNIVNSYDQDLKRADAVRAYAFAYDVVYNNLSATNRSLIASYLYNHAIPLLNMELYSDNNHRCRDAAGLGLAGLVLKNKEFIDISTETLLIYLYEKVRAEGGSYEGQSYGASSFYGSIEFMFTLKRLGEFNFFEDPKYLNMLDFMAKSLSPLALPPVFEDCVADGRTNDILLMSAAHIDDAKKAREYQWLWESRQNNSGLPGLGTYTYLQGYGVSLQLITVYNVAAKLNSTRPNYLSDVYSDSGMTFFRSNFSQNALFLSLSCKQFPQSHPHYDENSFELWAYGTWLIHNPGYPGFGDEGHDFTISTEGSNTLLINNEGQLSERASGLKSSVLSSYFEMVEADALRAYNSPGSFIEGVPLYLLMIVIFILLGISGFLFFQAKSSIHKKLSEETSPSLKDKLSKNQLTASEQLAFPYFLREAFLSPFSIQKKLLLGMQNSSIKKFKWILSGIISGILLIYLFYILDIVNFFMGELILTWQLPFNISDFYYIEIGLVAIFICLSFLAFYVFVRLYGRLCHALCTEPDTQFSYSRKQLRASFTVSFAWLLPLIVIMGIVFGMTFLSGLGGFFRTLFQSVGGTNEVVTYLFQIFNETGLLVLIMFLVGVPFFIITTYSAGYGISFMLNSRITANNGTKISCAALLLATCVFLLIFLFVVLGLCNFISAIGIEGLTGG